MNNVMRQITTFTRHVGVGALIATAGVLTPGVGSAGAAPELPDPVTFGCRDGHPQEYRVPNGVTRLFAVLMGGTGGSDQLAAVEGGVGGRVDVALDVEPNQKLLVTVGCAGDGRTGGNGYSRGGRGGDAGMPDRGDGGGGGGATAVRDVGSWNVVAVAAGGGGGGGSAGVIKGGSPRGVSTRHLHDQQHAEDGWKSKGGGGGGGGGGGWRTGHAGHGGSYAGDWGGGGYEGLSYDSTGTGRVAPGTAARGDGSVRIFPINPAHPFPNLFTAGCDGGKASTFEVPDGVWTVRVRVSGATGDGPRPGRGATVVADVPVRPGQVLRSIAGCRGGKGWANGGRRGSMREVPYVSKGGKDGFDGGSASAVLDGDTPLVVAGGGGGTGGAGTGRDGGAGGHGGVRGGSGSGSGGAGGDAGTAEGSKGTGGSDGWCGGAGGGGGGGWRGGRGGNAGSCTYAGGGGGGGSSYTAPGVTNVRDLGPAAEGHGSVEIVAIAATTPAAPPAPTVAAFDRSIGVAITPPDDDGGAQITSYTVTLQPGGHSVTTRSLTASFPDAAYGVAYTATVVATNDVGTGPRSSPSAAVTPIAVPDAPTSVTATAGPHSAVVSFEPGASNGARITSYTVVNLATGERKVATASPVLFAQLPNGRPAAFAVAARNAAGDGAFAASDAVTPMQVPAPPWAVTARAGDRQAVVDFEAPMDLGGAASVIGYAVFDESGNIAGLGTRAPITVRDLENGTGYRFYVVARTWFGISGRSALSATVTPTPPPPPPGPANDAFAGAAPISGPAGSVTGTIVNAGREHGEGDHDDDAAGTSVWYEFTFATGGSVRFDLCGSSFDGVIAAYAGGDVATATPVHGGRPIVGCPDGSNAAGLFLDLPASGGVFRIAVDRRRSSGSAPGPFRLNWQPGM